MDADISFHSLTLTLIYVRYFDYRCDVQLNEFLRSIKKDPSRVDFQAMINILITHAQSPEEMMQVKPVNWVKVFLPI